MTSREHVDEGAGEAKLGLRHVDWLLSCHHTWQADQCDQRRRGRVNLHEAIRNAGCEVQE